MALGCNRRSKLRKSNIGSKGLARDTIYNKGGYLALGLEQNKEKINKLPQSYYLYAYAKCDLKLESKQVLEK